MKIFVEENQLIVNQKQSGFFCVKSLELLYIRGNWVLGPDTWKLKNGRLRLLAFSKTAANAVDMMNRSHSVPASLTVLRNCVSQSRYIARRNFTREEAP